ncbi:hypothetical protein C5F63_14870 [Photobacterium damselae subsp. damselae]|nr:hypothetical protein C5F63_14870 [Photobacterium damselae subsp. damselae]
MAFLRFGTEKLEQAVPILVKSNRLKLLEFADQNGLRLKSILVWFCHFGKLCYQQYHKIHLW